MMVQSVINVMSQIQVCLVSNQGAVIVIEQFVNIYHLQILYLRRGNSTGIVRQYMARHRFRHVLSLFKTR